ncbi:Uncharacterised protein [Klebsiella pneumoniae]|nr:Uncharacterised protein [Klebsiella pneumoniae]
MFNIHHHNIPRLHIKFTVEIYHTVDFRRIRHTAADSTLFVINFINDHRQCAADFFSQTLCGDLLL